MAKAQDYSHKRHNTGYSKKKAHPNKVLSFLFQVGCHEEQSNATILEAILRIGNSIEV